MNIWLISAFEPTPYDKSFSARFISIANECLKRGHQVTFYSTTFKHSTKEQRFEDTTRLNVEENYDLVFIRSMPYKGNLSVKRLFAHSKLSKELISELNKADNKPDLIFMAYPPISTALAVSEWAERNGTPFIIDIIDPWPDSFRKMMKKVPEKIQNLILRRFTGHTRKIFSRADAVTGIAKQRLAWAKKYAPGCDEFHYFYPSADLTEVTRKLEEIGKTTVRGEKLQVIYAGSLASSYNIPTILKAADILSREYTGRIEFVIAGAGPQEDLINKYISTHENLRYVGRLSKEDLMKEYYKSDIGLIQHLPGASQTVTYKLFDYLSCGLPVMNSLESELNEIVLENRVGFFNSPHDYKTLADNIQQCYKNPDTLKEMKRRAIETTAEIGDTSKVYATVVKLMEKIIKNKTDNTISFSFNEMQQ